METEAQFKKILLQKGLERLSDYQFRTVKSLLASELKLSEKMTEDFDRIKLADKMFARFPGATCIDKLIDIIKDDPNDPNIPNIVSSLRKEKQNALRRLKAGAEPVEKKRKQDGASTSTPARSSEVSVAPQDTADTPVAQKKKKVIQDKTGMHREQGHQESTVVFSSTNTQHFASPGIQLASSVSQNTLIKQADTTSISPATPSSVNMAPQTKKKKKVIQDKTGMNREQGHQESTVVFSSTNNQHFASPGIQLATSVSQNTLIQQADTTSISPATPSSVNMAPQTKETPAIPERAEDIRALANASMTVKVLQCSQTFSYESTEQGTESMFHALVATTNHFFWVKVLDMALRECFTKKSVLLISGHSESRGILEVSRSSSVFLAHDQIQVPKNVMRKAREIPKIAFIKATPGIFVYGLYELVKKTENKTTTVYEIKDETGNIDVKGSGQCHRLSCEAGDKLRLFCFRLRTINHKPTLQSEKHSLIQVVKARRNKNPDKKMNVNVQVQVMTSHLQASPE